MLRSIFYIVIVCLLIPQSSTADELPTESPIQRAVAQSVRPPEEISGVIEGRVVNEQGEPIAFAEVGMLATEQDEPEDAAELEFHATGETDAGGYFAIRYDSELRRTFGVVWARAEGYTPSRYPGTTLFSILDSETELQIKLMSAESTTIQFVDEQRQPLSEVTVRIDRVKVPHSIAYVIPLAWRDHFRRTTGEKGTVVFRGIEPGAVRTVRIETETVGRMIYNPNYFLNDNPNGKAPHFTMCIPAGASVHPNIVRSDQTAPLPTAIRITTELWPASRNNLPDWATWAGVWGEAKPNIDTDGSLKELRIAQGLLHVACDMPADQPWRAVTSRAQRVAAGESIDVAIRIVRGINVRGRVVKSDTGEGYPGFELSLKHGATRNEARGGEIHRVKTDEKGWYEATMPPGWIAMRIHSAPQDYRDIEYYRPDEQALIDPREIPADATTFGMPPLELVPTQQISGTLIDKNDRPLSDWVVYGFPKPGNRAMNSFSGVHTNSRGEFYGVAPETHLPVVWQVSFRKWNTDYDFKDEKYQPKIKSESPLVLQVDIDGQPRAK